MPIRPTSDESVETEINFLPLHDAKPKILTNQVTSVVGPHWYNRTKKYCFESARIVGLLVCCGLPLHHQTAHSPSPPLPPSFHHEDHYQVVGGGGPVLDASGSGGRPSFLSCDKSGGGAVPQPRVGVCSALRQVGKTKATTGRPSLTL